jgi:hypothetical protein
MDKYTKLSYFELRDERVKHLTEIDKINKVMTDRIRFIPKGDKEQT